MKEKNIKNFVCNPFELVGHDWLLINTFNENKVNSMTASWGGFGVLWNKKVLYLFIRPQRYTYKLIENNQYFSVSILDSSYRSTLNYLGTASGYDEDKIKVSGLTISRDIENVPLINEATTNIVLRKLFCQRLTKDSFVDKEIIKSSYPEEDFHYMYVGEVVKIYAK